MLHLEVNDLRWIKRTPDEPADLCAHGAVDFSVDSEAIPELDEFDCCVGASALYLLRTLSASHTPSSQVGERLFPCCGHGMYDDSTPDVVVSGCSGGFDVSVLREEHWVQLTLPSGYQSRVCATAWQQAVFAFVDSVAGFYRSSSPKQPCADDVDGFRVFLAEWERRRGQPLDPRGFASAATAPGDG